jgi:hypothetical protein
VSEKFLHQISNIKARNLPILDTPYLDPDGVIRAMPLRVSLGTSQFIDVVEE